MKAIKCDRCHKYFDSEIGEIRYMDKSSDDHCYQLDICSDCLKEFFKFMGVEEQNHE